MTQLEIAARCLKFSDEERFWVEKLASGFQIVQFDKEHQCLMMFAEEGSFVPGKTVSIDVFRAETGMLMQGSSYVPEGWRPGDLLKLTKILPLLMVEDH